MWITALGEKIVMGSGASSKGLHERCGNLANAIPDMGRKRLMQTICYL